MLASGILGVTAASLKRCVDLGAGGVTIKSLSLQPRVGHKNPTMGGYNHFFINAVGLANPGVEAAFLRERWRNLDKSLKKSARRRLIY